MTETLSRWKARAAQAEDNRRRMPLVTDFVDDMRAHFGELTHVRYAAENGIEYGKRGPVGVMATQPDRLPATTEAPKRSSTRYKQQAVAPAAVPALF